jgi:hypothetical protein
MSIWPISTAVKKGLFRPTILLMPAVKTGNDRITQPSMRYIARAPEEGETPSVYSPPAKFHTQELRLRAKKSQFLFDVFLLIYIV